MRHLLTVISAIMLVLFCGNAFAQKSSTNDYNLKKAYEVLQEEKDEAKALDLVNKQLRETPDNVDALLLRVRLLRRKKDFGQALRDINHALKVNKPKKTEIQNSTLHWWKAYIYRDMGDDQNAAASFRTAYELAQKDDKDNLQSISFDYAQALYDLEDYAGADAIYRKMLALERDNKWLKEQREQTPEPVTVDDVDNHPLDKETAMEAIRYNGYVPEADGHWITFMAQGEHYAIDADRFPVMVMMKHYNLDRKEYDMDLMHKAAHQVSDDIIMGKVLFTGEEDGIAFQITAIENKYSHFKDCLIRYISIIDESQSRMSQLYNDMDAKELQNINQLLNNSVIETKYTMS